MKTYQNLIVNAAAGALSFSEMKEMLQLVLLGLSIILTIVQVIYKSRNNH